LTSLGTVDSTKALSCMAFQLAKHQDELDDIDSADSQHGLNRVEFHVCLLRVAIDRYIKTGAMKDVSDALCRLLKVEVSARLGKYLPMPDDFRKDHCYVNDTNLVLRSHERSLRAIFDTLATVSRVKNHINKEVWIAFLHGANLTGADVSDRDALLCFAWSRMVVHDGQSMAGRIKETCLPFEGFMEALCRFSTFKSLPIEREVQEANEQDAGTFLLNLCEVDNAKFQVFIQELGHRIEWEDQLSGGQLPGGEPVSKRVEHLIHLIVRTIERHLDRPWSEDMDISNAQMLRWVNAKFTGDMKVE